jgi:hypothetical protein
LIYHSLQQRLAQKVVLTIAVSDQRGLVNISAAHAPLRSFTATAKQHKLK